ncbi:MAG: HD domain-containing phosphohydrolase [Chloroherpetonaceae bacterium]
MMTSETIHILDDVGLSATITQTGLKAMSYAFEYHRYQQGVAYLGARQARGEGVVDILLLVDATMLHRAKQRVPVELRRNLAIVALGSQDDFTELGGTEEIINRFGAIDILETPVTPLAFKMLLHRVEHLFRQQHRFALLQHELSESQNELQRISDLGAALSNESDTEKLLDTILTSCMEMTGADAGSLYFVEKKPDTDSDEYDYFADKQLRFRYAKNMSRNIPLEGFIMPITPKSIVGYVALSRAPLTLPDVYHLPDGVPYSFGGRAFDEKWNYQMKSMLTVPMLNRERNPIGVIQLMNKKRDFRVPLSQNLDEWKGLVLPFSKRDELFIYSLASQAGIAYENKLLYEEQKILLESFIKLIADSIDKKSPYTGGHCNRVPILTEMLARAACLSQEEMFKDFNLTPEQWYELHIAAWLHDCGKVTTPVHVMDKATKLETIYDRIHTIKTRFEILRRDAYIHYISASLRNGISQETLEADYKARLAQIDDDERFLEQVNIGGEYLADEKINRIAKIGAQKIFLNGEERDFLSAEEIYNLSIRRGTLTPEERKVINDHIVVTIQMLEELPFPRNLARVPEYAGGHHEKMDGTGYPKGLRREQMSIPARIMAIADVFEALTAVDRPYKKGKTLSESMNIMAKMKAEHHLDPDLLDLFVKSGVYKEYAKKFMSPEQIDEVDEAAILAVKPKPLPEPEVSAKS